MAATRSGAVAQPDAAMTATTTEATRAKLAGPATGRNGRSLPGKRSQADADAVEPQLASRTQRVRPPGSVAAAASVPPRTQRTHRGWPTRAAPAAFGPSTVRHATPWH